MNKECLMLIRSLIELSYSNEAKIYALELADLKDCENHISKFQKGDIYNEINLYTNEGVLERIQKGNYSLKDEEEMKKAFKITSRTHRKIFVSVLPFSFKVKYFIIDKPQYIISSIIKFIFH